MPCCNKVPNRIDAPWKSPLSPKSEARGSEGPSVAAVGWLLRTIATLLELTASGIDIAASRIADRRLDTMHGEPALQGLDLLER